MGLYRGIENRGKEIQVFFYCQVLIEREFSGHITNAPSDLFIARDNIIAIHSSLSFIRNQQGRENTEKRGLSGTVRADKPEQFPSPDLKRDIMQGLHVTVSLSEVARFDKIFHNQNFTSPYIPILIVPSLRTAIFTA